MMNKATWLMKQLVLQEAVERRPLSTDEFLILLERVLNSDPVPSYSDFIRFQQTLREDIREILDRTPVVIGLMQLEWAHMPPIRTEMSPEALDRTWTTLCNLPFAHGAQSLVCSTVCHHDYPFQATYYVERFGRVLLATQVRRDPAAVEQVEELAKREGLDADFFLYAHLGPEMFYLDAPNNWWRDGTMTPLEGVRLAISRFRDKQRRRCQ